MTFTPSSVTSYISHFENKFDGTDPFYYEGETHTINFGYGLNLTAAEDAALSGNSTRKNQIISWFATNNIILTEAQWQSFTS